MNGNMGNAGPGMLRVPPRLSLDPARSAHFARNIHRATSYTVVQEKIVFPFTTSTANGSVTLIGPFTNGTSLVIPVIGLSNSTPAALPTNVPLSTNSVNFNTVGRLRLSRLAVSISCTGTNSGTTAPDGAVYCGTLKSPLDYLAFPAGTWQTIGNWLVQREEITQTSSLSLQYNPVRMVSYPLDIVTYEEFTYIPAGGAVNPTPCDAMAPIAIYVPGTISTVNFIVTINVEWNVIYSQDPVLQSTAQRHPVASDMIWNNLIDRAQDTAGRVTSGPSEMVSNFGGFSQKANPGLARATNRLYGN